MLSVYKRSNWISWCLFIELKSEEEFKDAFWNHIFVWECTFYQLDYMVAIKTSSSRNGLNWMKWKVLKSMKKVDEIEKLLNFLFIVWSVCFLFTNTDKSLAFFYSLIYIYLWGSPLVHFVIRLRRPNALSNIIIWEMSKIDDW